MEANFGTKRAVEVPDAPVPGGPYSHALRVGEWVFVSGQRPVDPSTQEVVEGLREQAHQVFTNLRTVLEASGASMKDVVKVTAHLSEISFFAEFNAVYEEHFKKPYPVRITVGSELRGILVEVDAIAICGCGASSNETRPGG